MKRIHRWLAINGRPRKISLCLFAESWTWCMLGAYVYACLCVCVSVFVNENTWIHIGELCFICWFHFFLVFCFSWFGCWFVHLWNIQLLTNYLLHNAFSYKVTTSEIPTKLSRLCQRLWVLHYGRKRKENGKIVQSKPLEVGKTAAAKMNEIEIEVQSTLRASTSWRVLNVWMLPRLVFFSLLFVKTT